MPPHRGAQADRWCWGERRGLSHSHHHLPLLEPRPHVLVGTLPKLAVGTPKCPRAPQNVPGTTLTCPMARGPGSAPRLGPDNSDPPPRDLPHREGDTGGALWRGQRGGPCPECARADPPGRPPPLSDTEGSEVGPGTRGEVLSDPEQVPGCGALGDGDITRVPAPAHSRSSRHPTKIASVLIRVGQAWYL